MLFSRTHIVGSTDSRRIGICILETPGLRRYESQTTDSIISGASTLPFAGPRCSTKFPDSNGSSSVKTRAFQYCLSVLPLLQLVETYQNQPFIRDKHELRSVRYVAGSGGSDNPHRIHFAITPFHPSWPRDTPESESVLSSS